MARLLRFGGLDGLNAAPLQWGLARGRLARRTDIRLTLRNPAESAQALASGDADVALIPTIELQRRAGLRVVPGISVAARRRVGSVVLLTRDDPGRLETIAVDRSSRTSVALLRILLQRRFGIWPRLVEHAPNPETMMGDHDGALLIADAALRAAHHDRQVHDLAELWADWIGLPFVFAVWAARPGIDDPAVGEILTDSRAEGLRHLPDLVDEHAGRHGNPEGPELTAYFSEMLHYTLGPDEEASLARFFDEACALGLISEVSPLKLYPTPPQAESAATGGTP
jgi:chorismate dehydratase